MNNIEKMYNKMRDVIRFCVEPKSEIPADDEKIKKLCDQIKKVIEGPMGEVFTKTGVIEQMTQMALFKHLWKSFEKNGQMSFSVKSVISLKTNAA